MYFIAMKAAFFKAIVFEGKKHDFGKLKTHQIKEK